MSHQTVIRITKEIAQIQRGQDLSLCVAYQDSDVRLVKAIIVGPPGTPYEYGFFEFLLKFSHQYPQKPPKVEARTTNRGRCRFNPNIYACGKVCLSILGTWRGETSGEEWSPAQGLESILWSIQSLMSSNPYENEPGFDGMNGGVHQKRQEAYVAKSTDTSPIRHETIRVAVLQKVEAALGILSSDEVEVEAAPDAAAYLDDDELDDDEDEDDDGDEDVHPGEPHHDDDHQENKPEANDGDQGEDLPGTSAKEKAALADFEPFDDFYKQRFLWYYETYCTTVEEHGQVQRDHTRFATMPFEGRGNSMDGAFQYSALQKRLRRVKEALDHETAHWATDGWRAVQREAGIAFQLQRQFERVMARQQEHGMGNVSVELEANNPFVWIVTYFGKPMSHLDGGVLTIRISVSPRFPSEQPRVKVETPIYHHRVSKEGVLCYFPRHREEMQNHVECIVDALEDSSPPFDPRSIVHPEATQLLWGSDDDKKKYHRLLRRSVQASTDAA